MVTCTSCNYVTYTPRSKKNIQREKPSPVLLDRIIEFRQEFNSWPFSKEEFTSKGGKYKQAFDGFPYLSVKFNVIDNDNMLFTFYDHIVDRKNYDESKKVDLNSYSGEVKFFKEKDLFIWKIKMK
jgi:hypothetical protein